MSIVNRVIKSSIAIISLLVIAMGQIKAQVSVENNSNGPDPKNTGIGAFGHNLFPASPTASMFAIYGQTMVNEFTGTPDISIPLYTVTYKDLSVPLTLSYQGGNGIKPSSLPGPVGNGWLFTSGGVITRLSKGIQPAGLVNANMYNGLLNLTDDATWNTTDLQQDINKVYLLANSFGQYDEYSYSFAGLSGKFYTDYYGLRHFRTLQGEDLTVTIDLVDAVNGQTIAMPSEPQTETVNGQLGEEVGSYTNSIIMKQTPYRFTLTDSHGIKYIFGGTDAAIEFSRPGRSIQGNAAGPNDWDGYNTEAVSWYLTSIQSPNGYHMDFIYQRDHFYITSEAYHSTNTFYFRSTAPLSTGQGMEIRMLAPTGRMVKSSLINPTYLQQIVTPLNTIQFHWSTASQQLGSKLHVDGYINNGVESNANVTVDAGWALDGDVCDVQFDSYRDVVAASVNDRFPDKLDYFTVYDANGHTGKNVHFNYTTDVTTRLKLNSVELRGSSDDPGTAQVYSFTYNSLVSLPDYLNFNTDIYGYFNGSLNTYITSDDPAYYRTNFQDPTWRQNYLSTRVPNATYAQAEILQKVTYPTGGSTAYEYEANDYGRVAQNWPPSITENTAGTLSTAGVRIKKITNTDLTGQVVGSKTYHYVNNYASGTQSSSGVLNYVPYFFDGYGPLMSITPPSNVLELEAESPEEAADLNGKFAGYLTYFDFGTDPVNPMSYNKVSHITYSEVTEENADGSFVVHTYKNYDNGYHDHGVYGADPINDPNGDVRALYDNQGISNLWKEDDMSSMELERGQVLSESLYDNNSPHVLKRQTTYAYNDDITRFADVQNGTDNVQNLTHNIRLLKCIPSPICASSYKPSLRYIATMVYTYYPYLKQTVQTENENGSALITTTNYTYDASYKLMTKLETTSSKGETLTALTRYPNVMIDPTTNALISPYDQMVSNHQLSFPIEKEQQVNLNSMNTQITPYNINLSSNTSLILPQYGQTRFKAEATETRMSYLQYDDAGNPLAVSQQVGITTCFVWSYGKAYPIAKIENAQYTDVQTALGGATIVNTFANSVPTDDNTVRNFLAPLRTAPQLSNAMISTYTYNPLFGVSSETGPNNKTTYYDYDNIGRLSLVRDNDKNVLKKICYNYAGQVEACSILYNNVAVSGQFFKNDCPAGQVTFPVTYPVAANLYQSSISQADADQQAYNIVAANGQAFANANGQCLCANCTTLNAPEGVKCINGQCETGVKVFTSRLHNTILNTYFCVYHYEWSDGSWSADYQMTGPVACGG